MTSPSIPTKREQGTKPTIVPNEAGEWIWARRPTPEQDAAWVKSQHEWRDRALSHAKQSSKLSVQYFRMAADYFMAADITDIDRASYYAAEGRRLRRKAREYLREARNRNV
jgi:hypothetical protein